MHKDGTLVASYTYGLFGTQDSYTSNAVQYTYYTYRPDGLRHSIGNTIHLWDGANIVADVEGNDVTVYFRGINLIYAEEDGEQTYYHFNAHGDVVVLTDENGAKDKTYSYTSFGIEYNPSTFDTNPFRYCGEYYDTVSGTIYLRARYYNADLGRFTQEDPIRDGRNWYSYCDSNPVNNIDQSGYLVCSCFGDETDFLDSPDMRLMGLGSDGRVAPITSPYDSTSYGTYMTRSNVAMYDASLGGYYSRGISSATANPGYYALNYQPTVGDEQVIENKKVSNKYGKNGGPGHQAGIEKVKQEFENANAENIRTEEFVKTEGGKKSYRFVDVAAEINGETYYVQVGRSNKTGIPNTFEGAVIRERIAYSDLVNYGHIRPSNIFYLTYKN